ncbi:MAG: type I methionyl aminopeptidase [bacterium]
MIELKNREEIEQIRRACRIVVETLSVLKAATRPGVTTEELDALAEEHIRKRGGHPAFLGYRGFPAALCVSPNDNIIHGIPGKRGLREGDIVSFDIGVRLNGYYGDAALTLPVGSISSDARKLLDVTEEALYKGLEQAKVGNRLQDISHAIQTHVESNSFSVVRQFVGHGIGRELHEEPQIPNFGRPHRGPRLVEGMVLCIEPMVNQGACEVKILDDGWTAVTADGKLSAHFEHCIAITKSGPDILTRA